MKEIPLGPRRLEDERSKQDPLLGDEVIGRVLRLVGPRPAVPGDAMEGARAAARAEWQRKVRAHARRDRYRQYGFWLAAAGVILALGLVIRTRPVSPTAREPVAVMEIAAGPVAVDPLLRSVAAGEPIPAGAEIDTGAGRSALRLTSGPSVRVDTATRLRLISDTELELVRGAVYVDSAAGSAVRIRTPNGAVTDVGTRFEVRLLADTEVLRVRVREGSVLVDRDGESHVGRAGDELTVTTGGAVNRETVATWGPEWEWVLAAAPPFAVEGRSLEAFLEWLCREGGWELRFADEDLAAEAPRVTLSGDMEGLTPTEAAEIYLRGSDLTYRLVDGTLVVEPRTGTE